MSTSTVFLALSGLSLLLGSSARADDWNKHWSVSGKPELRVTAGDASVTVEGGSGSEIEASVKTRGVSIGDSGLRITEHQDGNRVELELREPTSHTWFGYRSIEVKLRVPKELALDVHTGDGSIRLNSVGGSLRVNTGDGSIEGDGLDGILDARSGDGSLKAHGRFDKLSVRTSDGSVDLRAESGSRLTSDWRIETGDGSVHMSVPHDLPATVQLRTGDGSIHTDVPLSGERKGEDAHEIEGKLNGGGPYINVHTGDGSINLSSL